MSSDPQLPQRGKISFISSSLLNLFLGIGVGFLITQAVILPLLNTKMFHRNHKEKLKELDMDLFDKVRVLCYVNTLSRRHKLQGLAVKRTWGKRCNQLIFTSNAKDDHLEGSVAIEGNHRKLKSWQKTKASLKYIYKNHLHEIDWILEADDETYVVMENLRYMVYPYEPEMPIYFGSSGIVMSREALRRFVEVALLNPSICDQSDRGATWENLKECLENTGVRAGNSRDANGRKRMYVPESQGGYWQYVCLRNKQGVFAWSNYAVSFNPVYINNMYFLDYLMYRLKAFGKSPVNETLPPKYKIEHKTAKLKEAAEDLADYYYNE